MDDRTTDSVRSSLGMTLGEPGATPTNFTFTVLLSTLLLFAEIVVHGCFVPLLGAFIGSYLINTYISNTNAFVEIVGTILVVIILMRIAIYTISFESPYFMKYFILDKSYESVILARECLNVLVLLGNLYYFLNCIQIVASDGGLKESYLGESLWDIMCQYATQLSGNSFSYFNELVETPRQEESSSWSWFSWTSVEQVKDIQPSKDINAAKLIFAVALVTSSIIKMIYLTVLSTYLKSVDILMNMNLHCTMSEETDTEMETETSDEEEKEQIEERHVFIDEQEESNKVDHHQHPTLPIQRPRPRKHRILDKIRNKSNRQRI